MDRLAFSLQHRKCSNLNSSHIWVLFRSPVYNRTAKLCFNGLGHSAGQRRPNAASTLLIEKTYIYTMASRKRSSWSEVHSQRAGQEAPTPFAFEMSNSATGWRNPRLSDVIEGQVPETSNVKRWDGAARACSAWDNLRRVGNSPQSTFDTHDKMTIVDSITGPGALVPKRQLLCASLQERSVPPGSFVQGAVRCVARSQMPPTSIPVYGARCPRAFASTPPI